MASEEVSKFGGSPGVLIFLLLVGLIALAFIKSGGITKNIGYPKLFTDCQRAFELPVPQAVNNFAANQAATRSDWPLAFNAVLVSTGCPHRRVRSSNVQSL